MKTHYLLLGLISLSMESPLSFAETNAELSFDGAYHLRVPLVNTPDAPGAYQEAVFEKYPTNPNWQLLSVEQAVPLPEWAVSDVQLIATDEMPTQIFLKVEGRIGLCAEIGNIAVGTDTSDFSVFIYYAPMPEPPPGTEPNMCLDGLQSFSKIIPLTVYGLEAGTYTYSVNGKLKGEISLMQDNVLTE